MGEYVATPKPKNDNDIEEMANLYRRAAAGDLVAQDTFTERIFKKAEKEGGITSRMFEKVLSQYSVTANDYHFFLRTSGIQQHVARLKNPINTSDQKNDFPYNLLSSDLITLTHYASPYDARTLAALGVNKDELVHWAIRAMCWCEENGKKKWAEDIRKDYHLSVKNSRFYKSAPSVVSKCC